MVYPQEHVLLRFNGHFGTATAFTDRWSAGIRFGLPNAAPAYDATKLQTFVNAAQTAAITFHTSGFTAAGTNAFLDYVSGAQIGVSGKYTPSTQLTVLSPTNTTAGVGTPTQPWNTASVISLRTAIPRGRGSNGRVYWPMLAASVAVATGRVSMGSRISAAKTFLDALNVAAGTYSAGTRAIVASNVGGGLHAYVTAVRSDDRLDSIERRENDQPSTWSVQALA
jgi:hypothetical protein